jgi:hypothetical protein
MNRTFAAVGAAVAVAVLAGCGTASSTPRVEPDLAGTPTWGGCSQFSMQEMSIAEGARGARTLVAAIADYREDGDRVVTGPRAGGLPHRWLVDADGTIHADLEMSGSRQGWFVTGVKRCAAR